MTPFPPVAKPPTVTVIAVGNPYRRDDAVGAAVLAELGRHLGDEPRVRLVELDGEPVRMMQAWEGSTLVWVVDAMSSDRPAGSVHEFDVRELDARDLDGADRSWGGVGGGHALGLREAIEYASALDRLPAEIRVLGIEGESFAPGEGLSSAVSLRSCPLLQRGWPQRSERTSRGPGDPGECRCQRPSRLAIAAVSRAVTEPAFRPRRTAGGHSMYRTLVGVMRSTTRCCSSSIGTIVAGSGAGLPDRAPKIWAVSSARSGSASIGSTSP